MEFWGRYVYISSPDMQMGICVWAQSMQMLVSQKQGGSMTPSVISPSICTFGNPSEAVMGLWTEWPQWQGWRLNWSLMSWAPSHHDWPSYCHCWVVSLLAAGTDAEPSHTPFLQEPQQTFVQTLTPDASILMEAEICPSQNPYILYICSSFLCSRSQPIDLSHTRSSQHIYGKESITIATQQENLILLDSLFSVTHHPKELALYNGVVKVAKLS